jgi:hypothetical protein
LKYNNNHNGKKTYIINCNFLCSKIAIILNISITKVKGLE